MRDPREKIVLLCQTRCIYQVVYVFKFFLDIFSHSPFPRFTVKSDIQYSDHRHNALSVEHNINHHKVASLFRTQLSQFVFLNKSNAQYSRNFVFFNISQCDT